MLDGGVRLIEYCARETHSVLTHLPPPHRSVGAIVRDFIRARFSAPFLRLNATAYKDFILGLPEHNVVGGATYDALVAATQRHTRPNSPPATGVRPRFTKTAVSGPGFRLDERASRSALSW